MKISWQLLRELEQKYGDSYYLLDLAVFRKNYLEFLAAFRDIYQNSNLAYSYKTNYTPKICRSVCGLGGYAEVVSRMEYDLAIRLGVPPQRIIFNGPYKSADDLQTALLAGAIVNLDSMYEVSIVEAIARKSPEHLITVGIRCNFDIDAESISRFGFDVEREDFKIAFEKMSRLKNCQIGGLHCHFSTRQRSAKSYALRTKRMLALAAECFGEKAPRFINIGGGFFSKMSEDLQKQFDGVVPAYSDYAESIATQFARIFPDGSGPELIFEPGTAIAANVMKFVAKVIDVKSIRSKTLALVSGSILNIKPTLNDKNLPMKVLHQGPDPKRQSGNSVIDVVGYTCMENDYLYKGFAGAIAAGDFVVFDNVGAYTIVFKPPFIRPCPVVIGYDANDKEFGVIKRHETTSDVLETYVFS
jgi:diaminopimelate decarboxylase